MKYYISIFSIIFLSLIFCFENSAGKKIKQSLKVNEKNLQPGNNQINNNSELETVKCDTVSNVVSPIGTIISFDPETVKFTGYEKEVNSSKESFILSNKSDLILAGYEIKIVYKDMDDRMLHSRIVTGEIEVLPNESRRIDIDSWDTQHTYYYYRGNEPKKVSTPYKVKIIPLSFKIDW